MKVFKALSTLILCFLHVKNMPYTGVPDLSHPHCQVSDKQRQQLFITLITTLVLVRLVLKFCHEQSQHQQKKQSQGASRVCLNCHSENSTEKEMENKHAFSVYFFFYLRALFLVSFQQCWCCLTPVMPLHDHSSLFLSC